MVQDDPSEWKSWKAVMEMAESRDAFGRLITNNPRTQLDLATQYKFSPERWRLFTNGSRQFVQYGETSNFNDAPDVYTLQPSSGMTQRIESAESATYVVGTEMNSSFALSINQSLQGSDYLRFGPYNGTDGWYIEHRGDHPNDYTVDIVRVRGGTEKVLAENVELDKDLTSFQRYAVNYNWYNVGAQEWIQTYTVNGIQYNQVFVNTSEDGVRGPETANLNSWYELSADASTTGLELNVGSAAFATQSNADQLVRGKSQYKSITLPSTSDVWHPIYAVTLESGTPVNCRLNDFEVLGYSNSADLEMIAVSVHPSKTDASNFTVPGYQHETNSVVRDTENVSTVPDTDGVVTTPSTTGFKPGGWTLSSGVLTAAGQNFSKGISKAAGTSIKRQVLASDIVVFLARSPSSGGEVRFTYSIEQGW